MTISASRLAPAIGLFALSPLVGEYLFGNVAIDAVHLLFLLMPMYGGGVLLIREVVRRTGRGWPTIFVLGLAYGVVEEGIATQLLFNPSYSNYGVYLTGPTFLEPLGLNVVMTLSVLTLHTLWSICVPIALVEALVPDRSATPWLGKAGLAISSVLFVLGVLYVRHGDAQDGNFYASTTQLIATLVVVAVLVAGAFAIRSRPQPPRSVKRAPSPWLVGAVSLIATTLLMYLNVWTLGRDLTREGPLSGWVSVAAWVAVVVVALTLMKRWSQRSGWGPLHCLAWASGAALTYAWIAFPQVPIVGSTGTIDLIGNILLAAGTIILITIAARRINGGA